MTFYRLSRVAGIDRATRKSWNAAMWPNRTEVAEHTLGTMHCCATWRDQIGAIGPDRTVTVRQHTENRASASLRRATIGATWLIEVGVAPALQSI